MELFTHKTFEKVRKYKFYKLRVSIQSDSEHYDSAMVVYIYISFNWRMNVKRQKY